MATVTVAKADPVCSVPAGLEATYGQTLADVSLAGFPGWAWADAGTGVGNAGDNVFPATFTPGDTANYNTLENVSVTVAVAPAPLTVTAESKAKYAGGNDPVLTYTVGDGLLPGDTVTGVPVRDAGETPGEYVIRAGSVTAGRNYAINFVEGTFRIDDPPYNDPAAYDGGEDGDGAHGTFTVEPAGAPGGTATIRSFPDEGCRTAKVTVTDENGRVLPVTRHAGGTYTYTDPGTPVTVEVKFGAAVDDPFVDILEEDYYYDAVLWAVENGITTGTDDTHFSPEKPCTRAQMITFIWRAAGCPAATITETPFEDLDREAYYYPAVLWAYENGITLGVDGHSFGTDRTVSRGESVTFIWRAMGEPEGGETGFGDVTEKDYCYDAVLWAARCGVTDGTGENTFTPGGNCLRGQVITFLFRAYA